jgi:hypothetical protein
MLKFENIEIHSEFRMASLVVSLIFTHVRVSAVWLLKSHHPSVRLSVGARVTVRATDQSFMKFGIGDF